MEVESPQRQRGLATYSPAVAHITTYIEHLLFQVFGNFVIFIRAKEMH
jgi:hypothetical protein